MHNIMTDQPSTYANFCEQRAEFLRELSAAIAEDKLPIHGSTPQQMRRAELLLLVHTLYTAHHLAESEAHGKNA